MSTPPLSRSIGAGYTILVVDDDPRIVELLHIALGAHGYRMISAANGEDALKVAFDEQPDLVILDVRLPRRSGYEVCEAIRREPDLAHLPVIMVSALSETEARLQGLSRGADDYLPKPFSPKELIAKVRRALARSEEMKMLARRARELTGELERARDESRRAQEELRRERQVQEAYGRLSQDLSRLDRPDDVSSTFLFALMTHVGAQPAAILLPSAEDSGTLTPRITRGVPPEREHLISLPAEGELVRMLVALGRPVRREELERFPILRWELEPLVAAGISLLVPLTSRGRLVALAMLGEKSDSAGFTGLDLELAASLAQAAALAVEQASLVRHAEETYAHAVRTYASVVDARSPGAAVRAERVAATAEALSRELGFEGSSALSMRVLAMAASLDTSAGGAIDMPPRPPGSWGVLRDAPGLKSEILAVSLAFVDLAERREPGATAREILAHLQGDRHVLGALETLVERGDLALPRSAPPKADQEAA